MPTKNVSIAGFTIDAPDGIPPGVQLVNVKYRLSTDPDVQGSYTVVNAAATARTVEVSGSPSVNFVFVINGTTPAPIQFAINQTSDDVDYTIVLTVACNGSMYSEEITIPAIGSEGGGTYTWQLRTSGSDPWINAENLPTITGIFYTGTIANIGDPMVVPKTLSNFASLGGLYWELRFPAAVSNRGYQNNGINTYAIPGSVYHPVISVGGVKSLVSLDVNGIDPGLDLVFTV